MFTVACTALRSVYSRVCREKYYTALINDPELHVKLTGSWETTVGPELDTFRTSPKPFKPFITIGSARPKDMLMT